MKEEKFKYYERKRKENDLKLKNSMSKEDWNRLVQKRKNINYIFHPSDLTYRNNKLFAYASSIKILSSNFKKYKLGTKKLLLLESLDVIFIRQDPPYDMPYISSMHMLEQLNSKTRIINNPQGIRNSPEKLLMLKFKKLIPPTIITRSLVEVEKFLNISFAIFGLLWVFGVFLTQFYEENMLLNKLVSAFFLCGFFSAIYYKLYSLRYIMSAKPTISLGVSKM